MERACLQMSGVRFSSRFMSTIRGACVFFGNMFADVCRKKRILSWTKKLEKVADRFYKNEFGKVQLK